MKKLVCLTMMLASSSIYAQGSHSSPLASKQIYFDDKYLLAELTSSSIVDLSGISEATKSGNRNARARSLLSKSTGASVNFSKDNRLQFGFAFAAENPLNEGASNKSFPNEALKSNFSTSAFLNYKVKENYSLTSAIKYTAGKTPGTLFSFGVRSTNILTRAHSLTTIFNINRSSHSGINNDVFGQSTRSYGFNFNNTNLNQTDLQLSSRWNWEIDRNWSLSTGITAKHFLNNTNRNPFTTQRTAVTVFSVASYRF